MARTRVNTKFVVGLGGGVLLVAVIASGAWLSSWWRERDPAVLLALAEKAEKAGDNNAEMKLLLRAANRAQATHQPGSDQLFMRVGDMYMAASDKDARLYDAGLSAWRRALAENPRNIAAHKKLLEENHAIAALSRRVSYWNELEDSARKLMELDPKDARAYAYHAEAVFESALVSTVDGLIQAKLKDIINDLDKAMALDPAMPEPVVVRIRTLIFASMRAEAAGSPTDAESLRKQALDLAMTFVQKNPGEPQVSTTLARLYIDFRQPDQARTVLESVCTAHPEDAQAAQLLADLNRQNAPARSEAVLKALAAAMTNSPEGYLRLGNFYEQVRKFPEAIAAFQQVADWHKTKTGAGLQAKKNIEWQGVACYELSWLYMDLAERNGAQSVEGGKSIVEASSFVDQMRTARPGDPRLDVLDGRLQLIRNNLPMAVAFLRKADATLAAGDPQGPQWLQIKLMLAQAYSAQGEWNNALTFMDQILLKYPRMASIVIERGKIFNRLGRNTDALNAADSVLKYDPSSEPAKRVKVAAYIGMGQRGKAEEILVSIDSPASTIELIRMKILNNEADAALEMLKPITEREPDNLYAQGLEVQANLQLGRKDEALKAVDRVLARDPKNAQFQWIRVRIVQPTDGNLLEAQRKIIEGIEDPYARSMSLAQLYGDNGQHDKEIENYVAAEKAIDPSAEKDRPRISDIVDRIFSVTLVLASSTKDAEQQKQYWDLAGRYVQKAERLDLDGVKGKLYQGRLDLARGNKKAGVQAIELAVAARPDFSQAHMILGQAYLDTDRPDQALDEFRKAIEIKPDNVMALKGLIRIHMRRGDASNLTQASNYLRQALIFARGDRQLQVFGDMIGDPAEAIRLREKTYQQTPGNEENARRLSYLYLRTDPKQYQKAIDIIKKLQEAHPEQLELADNLARLYRETGQGDVALALLQKFTESSDATVRYSALMSVADLYRSLGKTKEAVADYQLAIEKQAAGLDEAQRRLADMYFDLDDLKNAELLYQQLFNTTAKQDPKVLRRLIETMVRQEKYDSAEALLDARILKQHPDDPEGLVLRGFALLRQRKAKEAIDSFNKVLDKNPNNLDALHYRAFAQFFLQGDLDQAARDLIRVRDQNPNALNSRFLLARVYRLARRYPEAAGEYRDVIRANQDLVAARVEYADFLYSLVEIQQRLAPDSQDELALSIRTTRANEYLDATLAESQQRFPDQPIWAVLQGNLLALRGKPAEAQRTLENVFHSSHENPQVASAYLASLLLGRNYEEVISLTTRLLVAHPEYGDYYVKRGTAYAATNRSNEALDDFDQALALSSKDLASFLDVVRQAIQSADAGKAIEHLAARLAANEKDLPTRFGLAQALLNAGRYSEAVTVIEPLMNDPAAAGIRSPLLRVRALALYQNKQFDSALKDYQALLQAEPEDLEALNNVAFMLADDMHRPADGLVYAERGNKILRTKPISPVFVNNGNLYDTYGWIRYLNGDVDAAIRELKRANQIEPLPIAYYHLARIYHAQKNDDEARRAAKEALRLGTAKKDALLPAIQQLLKELGG